MEEKEMKKLLSLFAVAMFLFIPLAANATPVGVAEVGVNPGTPYTTLPVNGNSYTVYTGYYLLDVYSASGNLIYDNLNSFCVDPAWAPSGISYNYEMLSLPNEARYNEAAWLFTQVGNNNYTPVDIQRAIWAVMGMDPSPYDTSLYDEALRHFNFNTSGFVFFKSPGSSTSYGYGQQDYISRVPEPATMLLLGLGLVGLAGIRRKMK